MLNKGQKIKIRTDLEVGKSYGGFKFYEDMKVCLGKTTSIKDIPAYPHSECYYIKADKADNLWARDMFNVISE